MSFFTIPFSYCNMVILWYTIRTIMKVLEIKIADLGVFCRNAYPAKTA